MNKLGATLHPVVVTAQSIRSLVSRLGEFAVLSSLAVPVGCAFLVGCAFEGGTEVGSTGGADNGDVGSATGGTALGSSEGATGSGGVVSTGGSAATGGSISTGGTPAAGGTPGSGGAPGTGGEPGGDSPFKGIAFTDPCSDLSLVGATWFYNWGLGTDCNPSNGAEYVPMVWGAGAVEHVQQAVDDGHTTLLGFNEPDRGDQANMTVEQAIALWPQLEATGLRLGSPAIASSPEGEAWLSDFLERADDEGLRVDFIAVHWYGWGSEGCDDINAHFTGYMGRIMAHGLPVWLTEWGCYEESAEDVRSFYGAALDWMIARPQIERYGWFLTRGGQGDPGWNAQRLVDGSGNLTALGSDYLASQARR